MSDVTSRYFRRTGIPAARTKLERAIDNTKKVTNPKTFISPPRTIKENLVNRGPGQRAAIKYAQAGVLKELNKPGLLKTMAKAAGKVGGAVVRAAAPPLMAYDVYDTAKTVRETVGAARELGRVRAAGRAAEQGAAAIQRAMRNKYPQVGTDYETIAKKLPKTKHGTTIGGGILKVN